MIRAFFFLCFLLASASVSACKQQPLKTESEIKSFNDLLKIFPERSFGTIRTEMFVPETYNDKKLSKISIVNHMKDGSRLFQFKLDVEEGGYVLFMLEEKLFRESKIFIEYDFCTDVFILDGAEVLDEHL